jgi:gas vesicle protein
MYEPQYEEDSGGGFLLGLLCGTALGAAVGLMFAPRAGSELRQTIFESTDDIRRKASDAYGQASEQVNNMVSKGKQAMDRGAEAFDSARQSAAGQGGDFGQGRSGQGSTPGDFSSAGRSNSGVQSS